MKNAAYFAFFCRKLVINVVSRHIFSKKSAKK